MISRLPTTALLNLADVLKEARLDGTLRSLSETSRMVSEVVRPVLWREVFLGIKVDWYELFTSDCEMLKYIKVLDLETTDWLNPEQYGQDPSQSSWDLIEKLPLLKSLGIRAHPLPILPPPTNTFPSLVELELGELREGMQADDDDSYVMWMGSKADMAVSFPKLMGLLVSGPTYIIDAYCSQVTYRKNEGEPATYKGCPTLIKVVIWANTVFDDIPACVLHALCPNVEDVMIHRSYVAGNLVVENRVAGVDSPVATQCMILPDISNLSKLQNIELIGDLHPYAPSLTPIRFVLEDRSSRFKAHTIVDANNVERSLDRMIATVPTLEHLEVEWQESGIDQESEEAWTGDVRSSWARRVVSREEGEGEGGEVVVREKVWDHERHITRSTLISEDIEGYEAAWNQ